MNIKYGIVKDELFMDNDSRITYGIVAYADSDKSGTCTVINTISDITSDRESLEKLVSKCNRLKLSIVNLYEVVEDYFGE